MGRILRSGVVVEIREAEAAVGAHRARLDSMARLGVPAHITVLFPFVPATELSDEHLERLRGTVAGVPAFDIRLIRTAWFGEDVLWLAPDDDSTFRSLIGSVCNTFPDWPPYGGAFQDVVPHLTVADHGPIVEMRAAEGAVRTELPIHSVADHVTLLTEQESGRWSRAATFPLGDLTDL